MGTRLLRFASLVLSLSAPAASAATLLFHAPFDGSPAAEAAVGRADPIEAQGLDWGDGLLPETQALRARSTPSEGAGPTGGAGGAAPRPLRLAYSAAHPGAKLHLNYFVPPDLNDPDFGKPDFTLASARRRGLDIPALEAAVPNLVVMQTSIPADFRWGYADRYFRFDDPVRRAAALDYIRALDSTPDFWAPLGETAHPWANLHDRYWESAIGKGGENLSCNWLDECTWRVSTLNPGGDQALSHIALPLRFHDALGISKGGFLVGTYGMEAQLAPFLHAFRSLPPVVLPDLPGGTETVKVRGGEWHGTNYVYAVNTGATNATVALPSGPVPLAPYSMQVFTQP